MYRIGYFTILATIYWATGHISHFRKQTEVAELNQLLANQELALAETRLATAQNAYFRQQLNPHLLFNALNFIYSSVYSHSAEASHSVLLLSDILRFSLEDSGPDGKVPLSAEVEQVKRIIALNRYRFEQEPALEFSIQGNPEPFRIIPLLLFTLTENVFKHGNLLDNARPAIIRLAIDSSGLLTFSTHNLKKAKSGYPQRQSLGLQNSRIRLDYSYAGKNSLSHTETKEFYDLHLSIQL